MAKTNSPGFFSQRAYYDRYYGVDLDSALLHCPECGADLALDMTVCPECGVNVEEFLVSVAYEMARRNRRGKTGSILTIAFFVALAIFLVIWMSWY